MAGALDLTDAQTMITPGTREAWRTLEVQSVLGVRTTLFSGQWLECSLGSVLNALTYSTVSSASHSAS